MDQSAGPSPDASIVIPLWNKVEYTRLCLTRLAAATPPGSYEVVLVDNGSTDATGELLAGLSGDVRVIRNAQNLGFARACNQGGQAARGRHIVFLNNDTEPHPGWLEPLIELLDTEPDVGVVGSKLLFPSGLVQHAGVWVLGDAGESNVHGCHRLYGAVPDDPLVEERSDVAIVTGAALAIRRALFETVGGFDEGFWNGYEDVDLCLKVREAGFRVVYEPRSTLTHHESVSGPERFSRVEHNERRLTERWGNRVAYDVVREGAVFRRPGPGHGTGVARPVTLSVHHDRRPARPGAVHVVGYLGPGGRPGRTMLMAADLLEAASVPFDLSAYHRSWPGDDPPAFSLNGAGDDCPILLVCVEPDAFAGFIVERGPGFVDGRYVIGLWGWPGSSLPRELRDTPRMAHELWVATESLRASVSGTCPGSVMVLPAHPGQPRDLRAEIRGATGTAGRLTFTAAADLAVGPGPFDTYEDAALAIGAFRGTFSPEEGPTLLVGVTGGRHLPWAVDGLMRLAGGHSGVTVLDLDPAGLVGADLAAAGDCHLALGGARGLAPTTLAALQAGTPVVAYPDPANPRALDARSGYLLSAEPGLRPSDRAAHLGKLMRQVAADPSGRTERGRQAALAVNRLRDRDVTVRLVGERITRATQLLGLQRPVAVLATSKI